MRQYVIDAFTDHVFAGNPAAACLMNRWLDEAKMMAITIENNLSERRLPCARGRNTICADSRPAARSTCAAMPRLAPPARS